ACTPQSIRMCWAPVFAGTVRRKKSPKPTRYMRTRRAPFALPPAALAEPFADFVGRLAGLALAAVLRLKALLLRLAALRVAVRCFAGFLFVFFVGISESLVKQAEVDLEVIWIF